MRHIQQVTDPANGHNCIARTRYCVTHCSMPCLSHTRGGLRYQAPSWYTELEGGTSSSQDLNKSILACSGCATITYGLSACPSSQVETERLWYSIQSCRIDIVRTWSIPNLSLSWRRHRRCYWTSIVTEFSGIHVGRRVLDKII